MLVFALSRPLKERVPDDTQARIHYTKRCAAFVSDSNF